MIVKRPSLAETMRQAIQVDPPSTEAPIPAPLPAQTAAPHAPISDTPIRSSGFYAATRAGKKKVTAALDPTTHKQLKSLAVDKEVTTEALLTEAISDLLTKHGFNRRV
jgi:hypothetical protein